MQNRVEIALAASRAKAIGPLKQAQAQVGPVRAQVELRAEIIFVAKAACWSQSALRYLFPIGVRISVGPNQLTPSLAVPKHLAVAVRKPRNHQGLITCTSLWVIANDGPGRACFLSPSATVPQ